MAQSIVIKKGDELLEDVEVRTPDTNVNNSVVVEYPNIQLGSGTLTQQYTDESGEDFATPNPARKAPDDGGGGGSDGGVFMLHVTVTFEEARDITTVDHTWQEIYDAAEAGSLIVAMFTDTSAPPNVFIEQTTLATVEAANYASGITYSVSFQNGQSLSTDDPDGYPTFSDH